jgi:hypothetical protein
MRFLIVLILIVSAGTVFSKSDSTSVNLADTLHSGVLIKDSLKADTLNSAKPPVDTIRYGQKEVKTDSLAVKKATAQVESPDKNGPKLIKRTYDFKSQIRVGIAMMLFIAVIFGTAQSWNP